MVNEQHRRDSINRPNKNVDAISKPSKRNIPKPLPNPSHFSYSTYLKYDDIDTDPVSKNSRKSKSIRSVTPKGTISENYKDDDIVVVQDNVVESINPNANNLNPFHNDFNKVIQNPFLKVQEVSMSTDLTDDNTDIEYETNNNQLWRRRDTVNTAIVDIYDSSDGCDSFLKMRVRICEYVQSHMEERTF